jgi:DNA repair protein RecN (Recombination protein N)
MPSAEAHARWRAAAEKLDELLQGEQDRLRMVDLWSYQRKEIAGAHLEAGEDDALETEKRVLANAEKLYAAAMGAFEQLYEGSASAEGACARRCAMWRNWPATTPLYRGGAADSSP